MHILKIFKFTLDFFFNQEKEISFIYISFKIKNKKQIHHINCFASFTKFLKLSIN